MAFTASLVHSLAWPIGLIVIVVILRRPIVAALRQGIQRLRIGPVDVVFSEKLAEAKAEIAPELAEVDADTATALDTSQSADLAILIEDNPVAAVMLAWRHVAESLRLLLESAGYPFATTEMAGGGARAKLRNASSVTMAKSAWRHGLINDDAYFAIRRLIELRELARHGDADEIRVDQARDYVNLARGVELFLRGLVAARQQQPARADG